MPFEIRNRTFRNVTVRSLTLTTHPNCHVPQGEFLHSHSPKVWFTTGLGPCVAVAMVNEESGSSAFCHLDDPYESPVETGHRVKSYMEAMVQAIQGGTQHGTIFVGISQGACRDTLLYDLLCEWCEEPTVDLPEGLSISYGVTVDPQTEPASADGAMFDSASMMMYSFDVKKIDLDQGTASGVLHGEV